MLDHSLPVVDAGGNCWPRLEGRKDTSLIFGLTRSRIMSACPKEGGRDRCGGKMRQVEDGNGVKGLDVCGGYDPDTSKCNRCIG